MIFSLILPFAKASEKTSADYPDYYPTGQKPPDYYYPDYPDYYPMGQKGPDYYYEEYPDYDPNYNSDDYTDKG